MLRVAQWYLFFAAAGRGTDYIMRYLKGADSGPTSWTLRLIMEAAPLWVWGALLLYVTVSGVFGEAWIAAGRRQMRLHSDVPVSLRDRTLPTYCAHAMGATLYFTFAIAALGPVLEQGWGWTGPLETFGYGVGHLVFLNRKPIHRAVLP